MFRPPIPFVNEPDEEEKVAELAPQEQVYIAPEMLAAAEFILSRLENYRKRVKSAFELFLA